MRVDLGSLYDLEQQIKDMKRDIFITQLLLFIVLGFLGMVTFK